MSYVCHLAHRRKPLASSKPLSLTQYYLIGSLNALQALTQFPVTLSKSPQRGLYVILTGTIGLAELMGLRFTVGKCLYLDMHLTLAFLQPLLQVGLQQRCVERDVGELVAEGIGDPILGASPRQCVDHARRANLAVCLFPISFFATEENRFERGSHVVEIVFAFCGKIAPGWCVPCFWWLLPCHQMTRAQDGHSAWDRSAMEHIVLALEVVDEILLQDVLREKGRIEFDLRVIPKLHDITKDVRHHWVVGIKEPLHPWQ